MIRRPASRGLVRSSYKGRLVPQVAGSPAFNRQRPVGIYARRLPRTKPPRRRSLQFDSDAFFAFALVVLMLTSMIVGTIGAAAVTAVAFLYIMLRLPQLAEIMAPRAFILVIPIFAVLSVLWSQSPVDTVKYSLEFALTIVVALLLSAAPHPKAVLWGLFLAFGGYIGVALIFGQAVQTGNQGMVAFTGLTQGKNLMADVAANGALLSLACIVAALEDRRPFRAILALGAAVLELYVLLAARSAGALVGIVPAVLALIFFLALRPLRLTMRLSATIFISFAAALMAIAYGSNIIEDLMMFFDKDPTLTGRTYLWQRAADFIAENPILGAGFNGFWVAGDPDAAGLWHLFGIADTWGFNFHNTLIELLVNIGWLGVVVVGTAAIVSAVLLLRNVISRPTLALCFWFSFLVYDFTRMPIEAIGTAPFSHSTLLLFAAFGVALGARRTAEARRAARVVPRHRLRLPRVVLQRTAPPPPQFSV
jgi:exopolysaccharide production protein ExoQ